MQTDKTTSYAADNEEHLYFNVFLFWKTFPYYIHKYTSQYLAFILSILSY